MSDTTPEIKLIAVDLDGTLLSSKHTVSERNIKALKAAAEKGVKVIVATGKTYASSTEVIKKLGITDPCIFSQGVAIYQPDGTVTHQETLDPVIARQVITFAEDRGFNVLAYSENRLLARNHIPFYDELHKEYGEPAVESIGALQNILGEMPVNKLIFIRKDEPQRVTALRWQLDRLLDGKARLMQTQLKDQVEILPKGASKGKALRVVLKGLDIAPENTLAIGDGENDLEMLELAGVSVAVGNADDKVKAAADHTVASNDKHGVAEAVERFILGGTEEETATESGEKSE